MILCLNHCSKQMSSNIVSVKCSDGYIYIPENYIQDTDGYKLCKEIGGELTLDTFSTTDVEDFVSIYDEHDVVIPHKINKRVFYLAHYLGCERVLRILRDILFMDIEYIKEPRIEEEIKIVIKTKIKPFQYDKGLKLYKITEPILNSSMSDDVKKCLMIHLFSVDPTLISLMFYMSKDQNYLCVSEFVCQPFGRGFWHRFFKYYIKFECYKNLIQYLSKSDSDIDHPLYILAIVYCKCYAIDQDGNECILESVQQRKTKVLIHQGTGEDIPWSDLSQYRHHPVKSIKEFKF